MPETLNELARKLYAAKRAEAEAKDERIEIEEAIAQQVTIEGDKGSKTVDAGDGLKVCVERKINYKADVQALRDMDLPEGKRPIKFVPASYAFDATAYEKIRESDPEIAAHLASAITATPAKVAVSLKV